MNEETKNLLCLICGEPSYATTSQDACPHCGDTGIPADLDENVTISLTKQELRILTYWSDAHARMYSHTAYDPDSRMERVLKTIFDRISMQTDTALTLSQEMANLRSSVDQKYGPGVELILFGADGSCLECGEQLDIFNDQALFGHKCGANDELPASPEEDTPPFSS